MTSFRFETVTIKANFGCHSRGLNPSPSACEAETIAMSYLDDNSLLNIVYSCVAVYSMRA